MTSTVLVGDPLRRRPPRTPGSFNAPAAGRCDAGIVGLRCLIVDDNFGFLEAARDLLGRQGINVVGVASSGREAHERLGQLEPDVMLVDVDLGEESGFDLARELAESKRQAPPIVLISAYGEHDLVDLIAASPALGFLSKAQLSGEAIRGLLERAR